MILLWIDLFLYKDFIIYLHIICIDRKWIILYVNNSDDYVHS